MLMVIFGAGASFDSSPRYPFGTTPPGATANSIHNAFNRPPLARELFADRPLFIDAIDRFPQCKTIVPKLSAPAVISGERSIETLLHEIEEEGNTYFRAHQELAAVQCYLQLAITQCEDRWLALTRGITNYLSLLREIERTKRDESVCLVTFNYDTLLENALSLLGRKINQMEDYIDTPTFFRVFKLHGSINWARKIENEIPNYLHTADPHQVLNHFIDQQSGLQISDSFIMCDPNGMGVVDGQAVFPAIAIPVEKKNQFECPRKFVEQLDQVLRAISKILVVGWRATEQNFLTILGKRLTGLKPGVQLYIVAGSQADAEDTSVKIFRALLNNPPNSKFLDPGGFTDFLESGRAKSFLES